MDTLFRSKRLLAYKARPEDIEKIIDLEKNPAYAPFITYEPEEVHKAQIASPDMDLISYRDQEGLWRGYSLNVYNKTNLELRRIAVSPRGEGFGKEALIATIDYYFTKDGVHRLWLDVYGDNSRGIQVYEGIGLRKEGVFKDFDQRPDGSFRDQYIYAITKEEWLDLQKSKS